MATFSEIDITFLDSFEVNTATNVLNIGYTNNQTGISFLINETIVTTRSQTGEFSVGTDAATQAQFYKDALDLDIVPSGDWEVFADGFAGWASAGPFDAIILTAAPSEVPAVLLDQLTEGGRLLAPIGDAESQALRLYIRENDEIQMQLVEPVHFVPMLEGVE